MRASHEAPAELFALQSLLFRSLTARDPGGAVLRDAADQIDARSPIRAWQRFDVHRGMFRARCGEVLESDFPILASACGPQRFERLVARYVECHPSRSWTLADLGRALPRFLEDGIDCPNELLPPGLPRELLSDLARAEWRIERARTAERRPPIDLAAITSLAPAAWAGTRLDLAPHLALLRSRYDLRRTLRNGALDLRSLPRRREVVLCIRWSARGLQVERLSRFTARLLRALRNGRSLGRAIEHASAALPPNTTPERLGARLFETLRHCTSHGFFVRATAELMHTV